MVQRTGLHCDIGRSAADDNMVTDLILPIFVADNRFAISLTFAGAPGEPDTIANDVSYIAGLIRPHLKRQILAQSAALLTKALDCALDGVLITDFEINRPGPTIVYANARMASMTGYSTKELIGQSPRLLQGPDTDRSTLDGVRGRLESLQTASFEIENYHKDGSRFRSEINITPVSDDGGHHTHFVSIQRDITERCRQEEARCARELLNRSIFDRNPMPMWIVSNASHHFLDVNKAAIAHYGWSRDEFLKMTLLDIRTPAEQKIFLDMLRDNPLPHINGRVWAHLRADGSEILVRGSSHQIVYDDQSASMSVVWDVTEIELHQRQQVESHKETTSLASKLKRHADELTDIQHLARLGSWRHLTGSPHVRWSDEMYNLVGSTKGQSLPTLDSMINCIHPDDRDFAVQTFQRVLNTGTLEVVDLRVVHPKHSVIQTRWHARQYCDRAGAVVGVYGYCQDITESKQAEDALRRSDKLKSLGQLTGGIAHDFNNLLTVVTLNLEDVIETLVEGDPTRPMLQSALHAAERGAELTAQLLSYSRRAILRPLPINVSSFIESFRPLLERSLGKRYTLQIVVADESAQLLVDPAQLDSALLNLVINARDSMPDGGAIQVTVGADILGDVIAGGIEHEIPGRFVVISVIDGGGGITSDNLHRVFEPFFTTKDVGQGSGLGLSMVYGFAKQSGGHVTLQSVLGKGTTARLYLPQHQDEIVTERSQTGEIAELSVKGLRVLVVEDQLTVLNAVIKILEAVGFEVARAGSAADARIAMASSGPFDLLFTDIMLAGPESGIVVAQHARRVTPGIHVILTTGFTDYCIDSAEIVELNAKFLMKPYRRVALYDIIREMFPQTRAISDESSVSLAM
jgi:PAS domain S-box-containing protein